MLNHVTTKRAMNALSVVMAVKAFAGLSMAAVAAFNVVADQGFSFSPTFSQDAVVAVLGGAFGLIMAAKA